MPGKFSDGFTKAAQKQKFVRNRDIKLKESELRKEAKIQHTMCEGVCRKCREKLQWRFRYDKYKPLKNIAKCQNCKQKVVTKAYRTLCDKCAISKKVCPSCCQDPTVANDVLGVDDELCEAINDEEMDMLVDSDIGVSGSESKIAAKAPKANMLKENLSNDEDEESIELDEDDSGSLDEDVNVDASANNEKTINNRPQKTVVIADATSDDISNKVAMDLIWDERKFSNIAGSKYSKTRKVGQEDSTHV